MLSTHHLGTAKLPWVVRCFCDAESLRLVVKREFPRMFIATLDGQRCRTKRALLREFEEAFHFPDYFGHNWDGLDECINDLRWLKASGYLVIVSAAEKLLSKSPDDYETFIRIMTRTGQEWSERSRPRAFHLVLATRASSGTARRRWHVPATALALGAV